MSSVYKRLMRNLLVLSAAVLLLAVPPAAADDVWSCSIIQEGKPQVLKIRVGKTTASMSTWITRLVDEFGSEKNNDFTLQPITNTRDAVVLLSPIRVEKEAAHRSEVSVDTIAINKRTGELSITTVSTLKKPDEIKGQCTL
jgi:hypothetical protein